MLSDDVLPQPYRFLNNLVNKCLDSCFERIRQKEASSARRKHFALPPMRFAEPAAASSILPRDAGIAVAAMGQGPGGKAFDLVTDMSGTSASCSEAARQASFFTAPTGQGALLSDPERAQAVAVTCTAVRSGVSLFGFASGRVLATSTSFGDALGLCPAAPGAGPVTAIASSDAAQGVFAVATAKGIAVRYILSDAVLVARAKAAERKRISSGSGGGPSALMADGDITLDDMDRSGLDCFATLCVTGEDFGPRTVTELFLSSDCCYLAAVAHGTGTGPQPTEVLVFDLQQQALRGAKAGSEPPGGPETAPATLRPPVLICQAPIARTCAGNGGVKALPIVHFISEEASDGCSAYAGAAVKTVGTTCGLLVAWAGLPAVSTYCLTPLGFPGALSLSAPMEDPTLVPPVVPPTKGDKGGANRPASSNFKKAPTLFPQCPVQPMLDAHGTRHRYITSPVTTVAACQEPGHEGTVAIGCEDGVVHLYSALQDAIVMTFNDAPHREGQVSVRALGAVSLSFYRGTHLVAAHAMPAGEDAITGVHRSRVCVYDIALGVKIATVPFLPDLAWAVATPSLPVVLIGACGRVLAADLLTGNVFADIGPCAFAPTAALAQATCDVNALLAHARSMRHRVVPSRDELHLVTAVLPREAPVPSAHSVAATPPPSAPASQPPMTAGSKPSRGRGAHSATSAAGSAVDAPPRRANAEPAASVPLSSIEAPGPNVDPRAFPAAPVVEVVNAAQVLFRAHPPLQAAFSALSTEQLAEVLAALPPALRGSDEAVSAVYPTGLAGLAGPGAGSRKSMLSAMPDAATTRGSVRGSVASKGTAKTAATAKQHTAAPLVIPKEAPLEARVRLMVDQREATKGRRQQRLTKLFATMPS